MESGGFERLQTLQWITEEVSNIGINLVVNSTIIESMQQTIKAEFGKRMIRNYTRRKKRRRLKQVFWFCMSLTGTPSEGKKIGWMWTKTTTKNQQQQKETKRDEYFSDN